MGAHATFNNASTVGISLMGNFEVEEPTEAQLSGLISLIASLSKKYHIDPFSQVTYFRESSA